MRSLKFIFKIYLFIFYKVNIILFYLNKNNNKYSILGIGDWGLGIGDWGLGIGAKPQSPIPNLQSPNPKEK